MGKWCLHASSFNFDRIIIKIACNQDRHKSSNEFDFGPDQTTHSGVTCLWIMKIYTFELEYLWGQLVNLDQILFVASLGVGKGCVMFWDRLDQNSGVHGNRKPPPLPLTYNGEKWFPTFSQLLLIRFFLYLQVTKTCTISDEFEFRPDRTTDYGVSCPWASKNFPYTCTYNGKMVSPC